MELWFFHVIVIALNSQAGKGEPSPEEPSAPPSSQGSAGSAVVGDVPSCCFHSQLGFDGQGGVEKKRDILESGRLQFDPRLSGFGHAFSFVSLVSVCFLGLS